MAADLNQQYSLLDKALKKISIVLVDEFEEIQNGSCQALLIILRKLLFSTSTVIAKTMKSIKCTNKMDDLKVVLSFFSYSRDIIKFSPGVSVDQFFSKVRLFL